MTHQILFYWFWGCYFAMGHPHWNRFVNPYHNRTQIGPAPVRQPKIGVPFRVMQRNIDWISRFRPPTYAYPSRHTPALPSKFPIQMDASYSNDALFWQPTDDGDVPSGIHGPLFGPIHQTEGESVNQPTFGFQNPSHSMVWNEQGQFWGYGPQSQPKDPIINKEPPLWNYGSDQTLHDDGSCLPPFCIPADCGPKGRCRDSNPTSQSDMPCAGTTCTTLCTVKQSCAPNEPGCGLGSMCTILSMDECRARHALDCLFGCVQVGNRTIDLPKCVCDPNVPMSATNQSACIPVPLERISCPASCSGRGTCDPQTKRCHCDPGYSGPGCEVQQSCPEGMTGPGCKLDIDECLSGQSGCEQTCVNTYGAYRCECYPGYMVDLRDPKRCVPDRECEERCTRGRCDSRNQCVCDPGFEGQWCERDVDECERGTHACEQFCVNTPGSYECRCQTGYEIYPPGSGRCVAVVRQEPRCQPSCVPNQGTCSPQGHCVCEPGFTGPDCAQDVDECATGRHDCSQQCVNTYGSFRCECQQGFKPDPTYTGRCLTDVCDPACSDSGQAACHGRTCVHGRCRVGYENDTRCECDPGYEGPLCELDRNECVSGQHRCHHVCLNTAGSYRCGCYEGYTLGEDNRTCLRQETPTCGAGCLNGGVCQASGVCKCPSNFVGPRCEYDSVSQCRKIRGCEQICLTDAEGNFQCACHPGYQLAPDGRTCVASEPCDPPCQNEAQCFRGRCLCKAGFEGAQCERDKNECELPAAVHGCTFECVNTHGSYECQCPGGYHRLADRRTCVRSPSGAHCDPPCQNGGVCRPGNQCECLRGYRGADCGEDINECVELRPCDPEYAKCVNTPGGFQCVCHSGYVLMVDGRHCISEQRARHAPHLVFRGRGQKGIVVATPTSDREDSTQLVFNPSDTSRSRAQRAIPYRTVSRSTRRRASTHKAIGRRVHHGSRHRKYTRKDIPERIKVRRYGETGGS